MSAAAATGTPHADRLAGDWVHWLLDAARARLGMEVAWVSLFTEGSQLITAATGELDAMNVQEGMTAPLEGSYCVRVLSGQLPAVVTGAARDPRTRDLEVTGDLHIGSYVGAPVRGHDARPIGMLCCLSRDPGTQLDGASVRTVELLADLISDHLRHAGAATASDLAARRARVRAFLAEGAVEVHLQPVVDMVTGRTVGYEALSRFPGWGGDGPAALFGEAAAVGIGVELEEEALRATLAEAGQLRGGLTLAVNLSPDALLCPTVVDVLLGHSGCPLAVEITEHSRVDDYEAVVSVTQGLRRAGVAVGVDDAGAGYASLRHILRLDPDVIKLDIGLVMGLHTDPARQAMTSAMVAFADETGARLVAEGVEHADEREVLVVRGVRYGQGYLFGHPRPAAEVLDGNPG